MILSNFILMAKFYEIKQLIKKITPCFLLSLYHYFLAFFGAVFYRFPSKKIKVVGITGTSGKTTTVEFISKILEEAGIKTAILSSAEFKIGNKVKKNNLKMTMPGRMEIQKFLRQAVNAGCKYAVLEVTSEGIKQYRHKFINFDTAIFTNLTPEHIESHNGFENYKKAKGNLFKETKNIHILNFNDANVNYFLNFSAREKYLYKIKNNQQNQEITGAKIGKAKIVEARNFQSVERGSIFKVDGVKFNLNILGKFNVYNALASICFSLSQGISLSVCASALEKVKEVSGRMEIIIDNPFFVIVDYAHTPEELKSAYEAVSRFKREGSKIICVLGSCGGGRDKWKRPVLGKIAADYCDEIIITNEDPYDEDPMEIIRQVSSGAGGKAREILDRKEAIKKALEFAKANDVVIITGKGSEPWMCIKGGEKVPWDDRQIVREKIKVRAVGEGRM